MRGSRWEKTAEPSGTCRRVTLRSVHTSVCSGVRRKGGMLLEKQVLGTGGQRVGGRMQLA